MNRRKKLRLVLDANWFVSACISRSSRRTLYYKILKNPRLQVFYSAELMAEFEGVMARPKFARIVTPAQVKRFTRIVLNFVRKTEIAAIPAIVRDWNDNYLLGICEGCEADFLITGDKDLLTLETYQNTTILTMGQFVSILSVLKPPKKRLVPPFLRLMGFS